VSNAGGITTVEISADGDFSPDDGTVTFTAQGPDIADVVDYTGDDTNWLLGRQLAVFVSGDGTEICFLKKVTVVSGDTYSLDGLIRARYDTQRFTHPAGTAVFIINASDLLAVSDSLLSPEVVRYAKTQPYGNGTVSLAAINPASVYLYGKGIRPPPIAALRVTAPDLVNAYANGQDVTLEWDWPTPRTPGTSAGFQDAGSATGTTSPEGDFLVELLTIGDALVFSDSTASATYTFSNAVLIANLGGQFSFQVRITQLRDGYASDTVTLTVEKT
jgi:hypothetical protein